jgi:hypothetical protein
MKYMTRMGQKTGTSKALNIVNVRENKAAFIALTLQFFFVAIWLLACTTAGGLASPGHRE